MKVRETTLPGVLLIEPEVFFDDRGWFLETFHAAKFEAHGLPSVFLQDNQSFSKKNVLRGLHYQLEQPQGKLVRCTRGRILDVAVDIRRSSPNFGRHTSAILDDENRHQLWIAPGFAHGFSVLSDEAEVSYKCSTLRHASSERSVLWNDPELAIDWHVASPIVSAKDAAAPPFRAADVFA
ncbi:MAG TPA: dTDP-4-dehydrorhamnose 3,5-epimerase [Thermoanaerobaculia bacterium]|nr:dTDP-4-dehydrorhamnose 3,5-epimerase [Thermoanaerobaculia bacterium]